MTEVTNKMIHQGLRKRLDKVKGSWPKELSLILCAYRTTSRAAIGKIPFSLVYGVEAVIPMEVQVSSFRTQYLESSGDLEEIQFNLDQTEYPREQASIRIAVYRNKMSQVFNAWVKP